LVCQDLEKIPKLAILARLNDFSTRTVHLHSYTPTRLLAYISLCSSMSPCLHMPIHAYTPPYSHTSTCAYTPVPTHLHSLPYAYASTYTYTPTHLHTYMPPYLHTSMLAVACPRPPPTPVAHHTYRCRPCFQRPKACTFAWRPISDIHFVRKDYYRLRPKIIVQPPHFKIIPFAKMMAVK